MAKKPTKKPEPVIVDEIHPTIAKRLTELEASAAILFKYNTERLEEIDHLAVYVKKRLPDLRRAQGRWQRNTGGILGLLSVGCGLYLIGPSVALITVGTILFVGSVAGMIVNASRDQKEN